MQLGQEHFPSCSPHVVRLRQLGTGDNASVGSNACLSVLCRHTNKFAALAGIGCSSVGVANLEITAGGFQHYPALGMNFKTL